MNCKCKCKNKKELDFSPLQPVLQEYGKLEGGLITVLQKAQDIYGWLSSGVIRHISDFTGIKPAKIMGVATFYTQFRLKPVGKNLIMLCQGTACHVNGSAAIEEAILSFLNVKEGETTPDGLFTLQNVACLGCCSLAPVMTINGETYGALTPGKARKVLQGIKDSGV